MTLNEVDTPALVLDRRRVAANALRMRERARGLGVRVRPHLKTLKSIDVARLAVDPEHGGLAVSTLNEAEYFASHGFSDIQLAVCLPPTKFLRAAAVLRQAPGFSYFVDSTEVAAATARFASESGLRPRVWIEIDSGGRRTGLLPDDSRLVDVASALGKGVYLEGVATHAGQCYADVTTAAIADIAEQERAAVTAAADVLRQAGFSIPGVSAGSTPTAVHARSAAGLTEWRPGVYLAGDLFQLRVGSHGEDGVALSVLATVISHHPSRGQMVIDAGGLALSKDRSTHALAGRDGGYGLVTDIDGRPVFGNLYVANVHQEHGEIREATPAHFAALPIGSKVRIIPNHACMTAAMYGEYLVTDGGNVIKERWARTNGWS